MSIELVITVSDSEKRRLKREFLIYEAVTLVPEDPIIMACVDETRKEFNGVPEDIKVRALLVLQ